jgi:flagella basal body P-ring formation protein FlgA
MNAMRLNKQIVFFAFAAAALVFPAVAAPVLRAEITVTGPVVTVGDMFEDAGVLADTPLFRAPRPGTSGIVGLAAIRQVAAQAGLASFEHPGFESVRVARSGSVVDESILKGLISDDLAARGILSEYMRAEIDFDTTFAETAVTDAGAPARIDALRYMPGSGVFSVRFELAGATRPIIMGGRIDIMISVPHLAVSIPAGAVLSPSDIVMREVPMRYAETQGIASLEELVGKQLRRAGHEGLFLKSSDVVEPSVILRNAEVMVYYRSGPLTITVKGQALNDARAGDSVAVLNALSRQIVNGVALPNGAVEIVSTPLTLANR